MGTITARRRRDASIGYTAQIRIKRKGVTIHTEAQTFDRQRAASAWLKRRETELDEPGALDKLNAPDPTLAEIIQRYMNESERKIGRTKAQVLRAVQAAYLGTLKGSAITSADLLAFAQELDVQPQTVTHYLSHLSAVFSIARPAWGYSLSETTMKDAVAVTRRLGVTGSARRRTRRPTLAELDRIMEHLRTRRSAPIPMPAIITFAIFSTRRLDEITRLRWSDLDEAHSRVLVRDMKHPGKKAGNDVWCDLPPEALRVVLSRPRTAPEIFQYNGRSISAAFTRAMQFLGIEDLHFHDLRHEGVSRLFEMGLNIPHVAAVSGHRSWGSLQRYTHVRQSGDKFAEWRWLDVVAPKVLA